MAGLKKLKSKIEKIMKAKKRVVKERPEAKKKAIRGESVASRLASRLRGQVSRKRLSGAVVEAKGIVGKGKTEVLGLQETMVEQSKYTQSEARKYYRVVPQELPGEYQKDKLVAMVRDPWWIYCYWEVTGNTIERYKAELKDEYWGAKRVLRVYDVSLVNFNGKNAHRHFDIEIGEESRNWYIDTGGAGRWWCIDFGLRLKDGRFVTILRSNVVQMPLEGASWITDEEWMIPEEMFGRLYGMGFGFGQSSPVGKAWQERMKKALFSGILASPGITSAGSPVKKKGKERKFWMVLDCELIVYGATEPDAKVTVQGKPIVLRPDGTFTMRYALPDGRQVIPVRGESNDGLEERTITPIVTRETKHHQLLRNEQEE
jgi:hypothetical protein